MENLKSLSLICNILVVITIISMSLGDSSVLQPNDAEFIAKMCKQTPYPSFCLQSLQAYPQSSSADAKGLALIMVDVIKAKITDAVDKINQLLPGSSGEDKKSLGGCLKIYKLLLEFIPGIVYSIANSEDYVDVAFYEEGTIFSEAKSCEARFSAGKSPLTSENSGVNNAAQVGKAITKIAFNITTG
ncbi:cell wall / vacuolar inhibitor of fructosidase 1-like [Lotus japonicus]|uniref:cell wall / vacuolar inhibitor of fructosidase 1-like n=1 Tax=Lotus japonicus TaxID=34305 RepID=UPI0025839283|nr:cell wall / vacuolar inhibitor of fructosidase 1-like [Lotus japonicus]